jgi:DNA mismatch repair ATPase MutS
VKLNELLEAMTYIYDVERLITRVVYENANAKELNSLKQTIEYIPKIKEILKDFKSPYITNLYNTKQKGTNTKITNKKLPAHQIPAINPNKNTNPFSF